MSISVAPTNRRSLVDLLWLLETVLGGLSDEMVQEIQAAQEALHGALPLLAPGKQAP